MADLTPLDKKIIGIVQGHKTIPCAQLVLVLGNVSRERTEKLVNRLHKLGFLKLNGWAISYTGKEVE